MRHKEYLSLYSIGEEREVCGREKGWKGVSVEREENLYSIEK